MHGFIVAISRHRFACPLLSDMVLEDAKQFIKLLNSQLKSDRLARAILLKCFEERRMSGFARVAIVVQMPYRARKKNIKLRLTVREFLHCMCENDNENHACVVKCGCMRAKKFNI